MFMTLLYILLAAGFLVHGIVLYRKARPKPLAFGLTISQVYTHPYEPGLFFTAVNHTSKVVTISNLKGDVWRNNEFVGTFFHEDPLHIAPGGFEVTFNVPISRLKLEPGKEQNPMRYYAGNVWEAVGSVFLNGSSKPLVSRYRI